MPVFNPRLGNVLSYDFSILLRRVDDLPSPVRVAIAAYTAPLPREFAAKIGAAKAPSLRTLYFLAGRIRTLPDV
jgi:hypothetical protein